MKDWTEGLGSSPQPPPRRVRRARRLTGAGGAVARAVVVAGVSIGGFAAARGLTSSGASAAHRAASTGQSAVAVARATASRTATHAPSTTSTSAAAGGVVALRKLPAGDGHGHDDGGSRLRSGALTSIGGYDN